MKTIFTTLVVLILSLQICEIRAQESAYPKHALYLELGGAGYLYSTNYEYHFRKDLILRSGIMFITYEKKEPQRDENQYTGLISPLHVYKLLGRSSHKLEVGGGLVFQYFGVENNLPNRDEFLLIFHEMDTWGIGGAAVIGYRYQPSKKGLLFRLGLSMDVSPAFDYNLSGAFGISFGYAF